MVNCVQSQDRLVNIEATGIKQVIGKCFQEKLEQSNGPGRGQIVSGLVQTLPTKGKSHADDGIK